MKIRDFKRFLWIWIATTLLSIIMLIPFVNVWFLGYVIKNETGRVGMSWKIMFGNNIYKKVRMMKD